MKSIPKTQLSLLLILSLGFGLSQAKRPNESRIRVEFKDRAAAKSLEKLNLKGDFHTGGKPSGFASLYATPEEMGKIQALGFPFSIESGPSVSVQAAGPQDIINEMNRLVSAYPLICSKKVYGKSVNGIEMAALKISDNVAVNENEPECIFDGGIHGDEFVGTDLIMKFAAALLAGYGTDTKMTDLINSREIWFFCMVNPDGRAKSRENANTIDLNRDYGYMTTNGFSQPETRAVRDCLLENHFAIQITYHSGIEYLLYPWCYTPTATPDNATFSLLANLYSTTSAYYVASKNVQSNADYATTGETVDYSYGVLGTAALTSELTVDKGLTISTKHYNANHPAMLKMIEYAGYGLQGTVTDIVSGKGIAATLYVNTSFPIYTDPKMGDYQKFVPAGTYAITVVANGYQSKTLSNIMVQTGASTLANISLQPDTSVGLFGYKAVFAEAGVGITPNVLGKPDTKTFSGTVVLDMQQEIQSNAQKEIKVHVVGTAKEYTCLAANSIDGPWKSLGKSMITSEFDLSAGALTKARYVRIEGGANLDAVEALGQTLVTGLVNPNQNKFSLPAEGLRVDTHGRVVLSRSNGIPQAQELYELNGSKILKSQTLDSKKSEQE